MSDKLVVATKDYRESFAGVAQEQHVQTLAAASGAIKAAELGTHYLLDPAP